MNKGRALTLCLTIALTTATVFVEAQPATISAVEVPKNSAVERLADKYGKKFPSVPQITVDAALVLTDQQKGVLLDVRSPAEQAVSRIPGAILVKEFDAEQYDGEVVITYCTVGYRSSQQAQRLRRQGIDARNLRGGILAWCNGMLPLETPQGKPTNRVHTYGASWNIVPDAYDAVH